MKIYRYALGITDHQTIEMPWTSQILAVQPGRSPVASTDMGFGRVALPAPAEHIDLWALVPQTAPDVTQHIWIVGTGNEMEPELNRLGMDAAAKAFAGSCVMPSGYVWHVFVTS